MTELVIEAGRAPVRTGGGVVATSQIAASRAGLSILEAGGNAADAAVAAAAVLAVTEPCSCGIGGDCFALYYRASSREVSALNGSGRCPLGLSIDRLRGDGIEALDPFSPHTVTVPGALQAWLDLLGRHGSLPARTVLTPAIELAANGFEVGPITAYFWSLGAAMQIGRWPENPTDLTIDGRAPVAGETFKNIAFAVALDEIASGGADVFYRGRIAAAIVDAVRGRGGWLDLDDLAVHQSDWVDPISTVYRGVRVWECPPNGQGLVALEALNILSALGEGAGWDDPQRGHNTIEALRLAFADANRHVADPGPSPCPIDELLSADYASLRAALVDPQRASADVVAGSPRTHSDTVYLAVVDAERNACSLIFSNYMGFGTGILPVDCGFTLQNRGHGFSLDASRANALAPGKRPYHTIIPALATNGDDTLNACFGVMGGFMQPQGHVQVAQALLADGLDPQAALDRPRLRVEPAERAGVVALEEGFSTEYARALEDRGHRVRTISGWQRSAFGRGQIIAVDGTSLIAGSDPRADGCALGQ